MKKIAIIGTVGLPPRYGGYETLAHSLIIHQKERFDFIVYCSAEAYDKKLDTYHGAKLKYLPFKANGYQSIIYDSFCIFDAICRYDTLLVLGVSGCIVLPFISLFKPKKVIVHIDGFEWKRAKWNTIARRFLELSEKLAVKYAHRIVADNYEIQRYIKQKYGADSYQIEYGGDHAKRVDSKEAFLSEFPFLNDKYAFTVCRIEPENNIHITLEAFSKIDYLPIIIVGNWDNSDYGKNLKSQYADFKNIYLIDAIYEQKKLDVLRSNCYVYIHGHSAGGTNPSLVEAMCLRLPIAAFDVNFNRATTENKALFFKTTNELIEKIQTLDDSLVKTLASEMYSIAEKRYRWDIIARQYAELF